jgi:methylenetetrahydrofolate reductase (NADPH)
VATRDRNRIALTSDALGASALGIRNVLCTTGTHTTLGAFRSARNVHDIDAVQLIQTYAGLSKDASLVGEKNLGGVSQFCIGGVAAPFADPQELQVTRLAKKVKAGARFLITQPIFDLERFGQWWQEVTRRGLEKQVAIVAGIRVLTSADEATAYAKQRPSPLVPKAVLARLAEGSPQQQKKAGIAIACETIAKLQAMPGLRGFEISADGDHTAALTVIAEAGLRVN